MSAKLLLLLLYIGVGVNLYVTAESCFQMNGEDSWLYFNSTVKGGDAAHYKLKFVSNKENGLIFYARGEKRDFEALFLNRGKLTYFLFNPTDYGTGSTVGVYIECRKKISENHEHEVEFYRNEEFKNKNGVTNYKSGIKLDGAEFKKIGYCSGVNIQPQFFLGGTKEDITTEVPKFKGKIKNFIEETTGQIFEKATFQQAIQSCEEPTQ